MPSFKDLTGKQFGLLHVISRAPSRSGRTRFLCQCQCGNQREAYAMQLTGKRMISCGCENLVPNFKHGESKSREYRIWADMRRRCSDEKNKNYKDYGARGISVCERWQEFSNFLADMGRANGLTIERIDNYGNYEPGNCEWVSRMRQSNNRRSTRFIEHKGKSQSMSDWAREAGLGRDVLKRRLQLGWTVEKALTKGVSA